jgi:glycosyltransferase involved in cell wall biosynthesis
MKLVMIPFHDWKKCEREGFRTRDAHLMQEFGKHPLVEKMLVINRPVSLSEIVLLRRNWRVRHGSRLIRKHNLCISQGVKKGADDHIFNLDMIVPEIIRPILMRRHWTPYIFGQNKIAKAVSWVLEYLNMDRNYALFISAPLFTPLVEKLHPAVFIADAQDNFLKLESYRNTPHLEQYYQFWRSHADMLISNSHETARWLRQSRPDAECIPNGVDFTFFRRDVSYEIPSDMRAIERPVVGFAGKMEEMSDVDLIRHLIETMPEVSFVFIGQLLNPRWVKSLWRYPNAHYLGDKPYSQLPQYIAAFDVCIIPYSQKRQHGVDPLKFYEYLAMGKPVVTTLVGDVARYAAHPQVRIGKTNDAFIQGVKFFLKKIRHNDPPEIAALPDQCSWKIKADYIIRKIDRLNMKN